MKCNKCGSANIVLIEWMGAADMYLAVRCLDCNSLHHRSGLPIIREFQLPKYGPVYFECIGKHGNVYYKNNTEIFFTEEQFNDLQNGKNK